MFLLADRRIFVEFMYEPPYSDARSQGFAKTDTSGMRFKFFLAKINV